MRNYEIKRSGPLLNERGELAQTGFARSLLLKYDRSAIKARSWRIKEWDYYLIGNDRFALALTVADNSYMALISVSLLDFEQPHQVTRSMMELWPAGRMKLPSSSRHGDVEVRRKWGSMSFLNDGTKRRIRCEVKEFENLQPLKAEFILTDEPEESIVMATPFPENKKAFYYNQKINGMRAEGSIRLGDREYASAGGDTFAVLDWGRGVWPYAGTWYWGSASGTVNGKTFGFNLGYGFGDTSAATENMLFYQGKGHKLDDVAFHIPVGPDGKEDYMKSWHFTSSDGRFEMNFEPVIDRFAHTSALVISSTQHQVFGRFSGKAVLDSGEVLHIENLFGFAEKVKNRW